MKRVSWDEYFIDIAFSVSKRSTCPSRMVGAILVDPNTRSIRSTGYNGSARGTDHCPDHGTGSPDCNALHAETNVIINSALNGVSTNGCSLYLTCSPCVVCAANILNAGIKRVVYAEPYRDLGGVSYLINNGIEVLSLNNDS